MSAAAREEHSARGAAARLAAVAAILTAGCAGRGASSATPVSTTAASGAPGAWPPGWRDLSPHQARRLVVGDGHVGLQYLDWGGRGPVLVLLPGLGSNAHVYDDLAPRLTDRFHVVALAPRGVAPSDAPPAGYTLATVAADIRALIDQFGADRVVLGAHSIGGVAITHFAARYPERLQALVYINASPEGWTRSDSCAPRDPVPRPRLRPEVAVSDDGYRRYMASYVYGAWTPALEAELRTFVTGPDGERRRRLVQQYVDDAAARPASLRDLRGVQVPVLALCAIPQTRDRYPWLVPGTADHARAERFVERAVQPEVRARCEAFESLVPTARAVRVPGSHFLFVQQPDVVAREIRRLVLPTEGPQ